MDKSRIKKKVETCQILQIKLKKTNQQPESVGLR